MKNCLLLFAGILFTVTSSTAQTWLWGEQSNVALKTDVYEGNVATNKTGNVYQAGGYETSVSFGSTALTSQAEEDIFLAKYGQNGNVLWAKTSTGGPNSFAVAYAAATDDSDNAYVEGWAGNAAGYMDTISFGSTTLILPYYGYLFLVKYDPNGNVLWAKQPDTTIVPDGYFGLALTTDKFKHEYVSGMGVFLLKYDNNGNLIWSVSNPYNYNNFDNSITTALATDPSGNIFMSGFFEDTLIIGSNQFYSFDGAAFVAKFDSNGTVLWAQQSYDNSIYTYYYDDNSITTDRAGDAYLTGSYVDSIQFGNVLLTNTDSFANTFYVVKFNPGGSVAWGEQATALQPNLFNSYTTYSICSDDSNHIYLAGAYGVNTPGSQFVFSTDTINIFDTDTYDAPTFMFKMDTTGLTLCSATLTAGSGNEPNAITADPTGNFVYVGGSFSDNFYIGNTLLSLATGVSNTYVGRWQSCYQCNLAVTPPLSQSVCSGSAVTLTTGGAQSYSWAPAAGLNTTTGSSVTANPTITTTYTVTYSENDCSAKGTCVVTVQEGPNKPVITVSVTGDTLYSSARNGNQWFFNDTLITGATDSFYVITGRPKGRYYVVVTNIANGCNITSDSTTGVNQLSVNSEQLSVYPNPTNSSVFVKINSSAGDVKNWSLQVTDVLGQTLYTMPSLNYSNEIDLSALQGGIYFIAVLTKTGRLVVPVVKE